MVITVNLTLGSVRVQRINQVAVVSYSERHWKVVLEQFAHPGSKVDPTNAQLPTWSTASPLKFHDLKRLDAWLQTEVNGPEFREAIHEAFARLAFDNLIVQDRMPI